jgi:hypothetical protein
MKEIGTLYVDTLKYPHRKFLPIVEKGWTNEIEEPYRRGSCLVFRFPFTKPGLVIGRWKYNQDETEALINAIIGRPIEDVTLDEMWEWK